MSLWGFRKALAALQDQSWPPLSHPAWMAHAFYNYIFLGAVFIFMYFFIKEPVKGAAEPELGGIALKSYNYNISLSSVKSILTRKVILAYDSRFFLNNSRHTFMASTLYAAK